MPTREIERRFREIFDAHNAREEERQRAAEAEKKRRHDAVMQIHEHLSKVVTPRLRRLAESIQMGGQKATVVETGPIGSPETSIAQVKLRPFPGPRRRDEREPALHAGRAHAGEGRGARAGAGGPQLPALSRGPGTKFYRSSGIP